MTANDHRARLGSGFVLGLSIALAGCVQGTGPVTSETRAVGPFTTIEAGAGIQVQVSIGSPVRLEVSAQSNVLPVIATTVSGDTLTIDASEDFPTSEPVTVTVTAPALDGISLSGGAQARLDGVAADELALTVKGGARLTVVGSSGKVTLTADGGSTADLRELVARTVAVSLAGGATATVSASDAVNGSASGGARLTVIGGADLDVAESGGAAVVSD
jgi:hypothetical protein